jgi:hypothetical protein
MSERRRAFRRPSSRIGGQALLIALAAVIVLSLLAASMAARVEIAAKGSAALEQRAKDSVAESSALAVVMSWIATHQPGPGGWGLGQASMLRGDGREYLLPDGTVVSVQDQSGLLSVNIVDRTLMTRFLKGMGVAESRIDAMIDILEDYIDTDSLRRLNGAEGPEYEALGLPGPRNDWMASTREVQRLPLWREELQRNPRILALLSARRGAGLNPNTAPLDLLAAVYPAVGADSLALFDNMRRERPFDDEDRAQRLTGLPLSADDSTFWVGRQVWIRARHPGHRRGREYNVLFTPASATHPWIVLEHRLVFDWPDASPRYPPPTPFPGLNTQAHASAAVP